MKADNDGQHKGGNVSFKPLTMETIEEACRVMRHLDKQVQFLEDWKEANLDDIANARGYLVLNPELDLSSLDNPDVHGRVIEKDGKEYRVIIDERMRGMTNSETGETQQGWWIPPPKPIELLTEVATRLSTPPEHSATINTYPELVPMPIPSLGVFDLEKLDLHECYGTEHREETEGDTLKHWTICEYCGEEWLSFMGSLEALKQLDLDGMSPEEELRTINRTKIEFTEATKAQLEQWAKDPHSIEVDGRKFDLRKGFSMEAKKAAEAEQRSKDPLAIAVLSTGMVREPTDEEAAPAIAAIAKSIEKAVDEELTTEVERALAELKEDDDGDGS